MTTWLLWDDERLPAASSDSCAYPLTFVLDADTRYSDESDPLRAIAFRPALVEKLVDAAGLRIRSSTRGSWDGATRSDTWQDVMILEVKNPNRLQLRRTAGRVKRRLTTR